MDYSDYKRTKVTRKCANQMSYVIDDADVELGVLSRAYYCGSHNGARVGGHTWVENNHIVRNRTSIYLPGNGDGHITDWDNALQAAFNTPMTYFEHFKVGRSTVSELLNASIKALYFMKMKQKVIEGRADKKYIPVKLVRQRLPDFNLDVKFEQVDDREEDSYNPTANWGRYRFVSEKTNIRPPEYVWAPYDKNLRIADFRTDGGQFHYICPMFMSLQPCNKSWRILFHSSYDGLMDEPIIVGTAQSLKSANEKATAFLGQLALGCVTHKYVTDTDRLWKLDEDAGVVGFEDYPVDEAVKLIDYAERRAWAGLDDHPYLRFFKEKVNEVFLREDKEEHTFNPTSCEFEI